MYQAWRRVVGRTQMSGAGFLVPAAVGGGLQDVEWIGLENATATGNSLEKTGGDAGEADAGGYSQQSIISGDGYIEWKRPSTAHNIICALSSDYDPSFADATYDYSIEMGGAGWAIYENGVYQTDASSADNDVFKIQITSGVVTYYKNGGLIDTSGLSVVYPVKFVCSMKTAGAQVTEAKIFF